MDSEENSHKRTDSERTKTNQKMSLSDFLLITIKYLLLPSMDVYSDVANTMKIGFGLYEVPKIAKISTSRYY